MQAPQRNSNVLQFPVPDDYCLRCAATDHIVLDAMRRMHDYGIRPCYGTHIVAWCEVDISPRYVYVVLKRLLEQGLVERTGRYGHNVVTKVKTPPPTVIPLTRKQWDFVEAYVASGDPHEAVRMAGYYDRYPANIRSTADYNLANPRIQAAIRDKQATRNECTRVAV